MNAERLHAVAIALSQEMSDTPAKLQQVVNALQQVVNQPHPSHQQNLSQALKAMSATVSSAPSDSFSPAWRQILTELNGDELVGQSLKTAIENIFSRNQITPAVALEELQALHKHLQAFKNALDQVLTAFKHLKIGDEKLNPGDCEVGILVPRAAIDNRLLDFAAELKEIGFILNTLAEVATGHKDGQYGRSPQAISSCTCRRQHPTLHALLCVWNALLPCTSSFWRSVSFTTRYRSRAYRTMRFPESRSMPPN